MLDKNIDDYIMTATVNGEMEVKILNKIKNQMEDSIEQYKSAGRMDLVENEQRQLNIVKEYLPEEASTEDVVKCAENVCNHIIAENGGLSMKDMRNVLAGVQIQYPTASGSVVSDVVKRLQC